jgi:glycosyltransferase involved in cell wall biosynthesis
MRILCLEQFSDLGGGQLSLLDLLPALRRRGCWPLLATPGEGRLTLLARKGGFEVSTFNSRSYANGRKTLFDATRYACESPKLISSIGRMLSENRIDLLYVNAPRLLPAAAITARLRRLPLVFHCHNRILQRAGVFAIGESLRVSHARVIACCRYAADPIRRYVGPDHVLVLYNGVGQISSQASVPRTRLRRIGVIGRVEPEKGQMDFIRAARSVSRKFPDCSFSIIGAPLFSGDKYLRQVVRASRELPVNFLGWRDDIVNVLGKLDLLVVPSTPVDSAPRVIFEAFAAGVPVVAFPSGGIPEIISDEDTGFLSTAITSDALAQRICSVLEMDPVEVQAVTTRAWKRWQHEYTLDIYQDRVVEFLFNAAGH